MGKVEIASQFGNILCFRCYAYDSSMDTFFFFYFSFLSSRKKYTKILLKIILDREVINSLYLLCGQPSICRVVRVGSFQLPIVPGDEDSNPVERAWGRLITKKDLRLWKCTYICHYMQNICTFSVYLMSVKIF